MEMNLPIYAALLGGALLILQNLLVLSVGMYRNRLKKGVGVDGDMTLERLVRRHGNLAENAGIFVAVLAIYEVMFGQTGLALWTAIIFAAARALHVIGFSSLAGSHLIGAEGSGKVFMLIRASGAMVSAFTSIILGGGLLFAALT